MTPAVSRTPAASVAPVSGAVSGCGVVNGTRPSHAVLNFLVVAQLARDLQSDQDALTFVDGFASLLPERIATIRAELTRPAMDDRLSGLLGLYASSVMAGATQLEHTTTEAMEALKSGTISATFVQTLYERLLLEADTFNTTYEKFRGQHCEPRGQLPSDRA